MNCKMCDGTGRLAEKNAAYPWDYVTFQCDECQGSGVEPEEERTNGKANSQSEIVGESGPGIAANLVGGTGISRATDSRGGNESGY